MTVTLENGVIHLQGSCPVEDAESLVKALESAAAPIVDWSQCRQLHGAVVQVLLVFRPGLRGEPDDAFLKSHLGPALRAALGRSGALAGASDI